MQSRNGLLLGINKGVKCVSDEKYKKRQMIVLKNVWIVVEFKGNLSSVEQKRNI